MNLEDLNEKQPIEENKKFLDCRDLYTQILRIDKRMERLVLCDLCPSLEFYDKKYKRVNRIILPDREIILNHGFENHGFMLFTLADVSFSSDFLLYYKYVRTPIHNFDCPPELYILISCILKYDPEIAIFLIEGEFLRALRSFHNSNIDRYIRVGMIDNAYECINIMDDIIDDLGDKIPLEYHRLIHSISDTLCKTMEIKPAFRDFIKFRKYMMKNLDKFRGENK